jgi:hypothetical protein
MKHSNLRVSGAYGLKAGDYVIATEFNDGNPADRWSLGFFTGKVFNDGTDCKQYEVEVLDNINCGKLVKCRFGKVKKITRNVGLFMVERANYIGSGLPGSFKSIWKHVDEAEKYFHNNKHQKAIL